MKYALVHEWLTPEATGGSELVVREILEHIEADIYALIDFESSNPDSYLYGRKIGTTFLQKFPYARFGVQKYLPLLPLAIEQLDLRDYEVIVSSSHAVAKGVLTTGEQLHICYCHTPMRYAWDLTFDYLKNNPLGKGLPGILTRYFLHQIRQWDINSANRVDYFIANSQHTARRIWRCYRRKAKVIYPPVNIDRFSFHREKDEYYLTVCRLVSYKKVSLIVEAFNELGKPLVIIGEGSELKKISQLAKPNIKILGSQPNEVVEKYLARAKAFVYAAIEDFGIALVEAMASGTPVIAYGKGGAKETVRDIRENPTNGTGILYQAQTKEALSEAVNLFCEWEKKIQSENCFLQASRFSRQVFAQEFLGMLESCYQGKEEEEKKNFSSL